jgi:mRNA interferase MazF
MKRGEIYDARLEPVEGSEQGGTRPVIIVSLDAINANSPVVLAVPCTTYQPHKRIYPTQVLLTPPEGGLSNDSIAMADQVRVLSKARLLRLRGTLGDSAIAQLNQALLIALDLPIPLEVED